MAYPVLTSPRFSGREMLVQTIKDIGDDHNNPDVLLAYAPHPQVINTGPTPDSARASNGSEISLPNGGMRAFSVADVAILFAIKGNVPSGAHGDRDSEGKRRVTLMTTDRMALYELMGNVLVVDASLFTPLRPNSENFTYVCKPEDTPSVRVYGEVVVNAADLDLPVFEVRDPSSAFYKDREPNYTPMIRRPAELLTDPILPLWLNLDQ